MRRLLTPLALVLVLATSASAQSVILSQYPPGRAAAASSLSLTLSTEDKAVLDAIAASLSVMDDWDETDRLKVNAIVGQAGMAGGNGTAGSDTLRVTVASNSTGVLAVTQSGTWNVATVTALTTLGTITNVVHVDDNASSLTVDNGGTFVVQVNGSALTSLQLIDDLVLAEDGVHASGESGILTLGVRNDAGTALAADGDRIPLSMDSSGAVRVTGGGGGTQYTEGDVDTTITGSALLWEGASNTLTTVAAGTPLPVTCATCSGTGVQHIDDAAFTPATDDIVPAGAMFDDVAPDSVNEGDGGVVRMSANRNLYVTLRDAAGNERGLNVDASGQVAVTVAGSALTSLQLIDDAVSGTGFNISQFGGTNVVNGGVAGVLSIGGNVAHDGAMTANPIAVGGYASAAAPTSVSADGDVVRAWYIRNGSAAVTLTAAGALIGGDATNGIDVDVTRVTGTVTVDSELSTAAAASDDFANPTTAGILSFNMCYDGSTWDRCRVATTTEQTHDTAVTATSVIGGSVLLLAKDFDGAALPNVVSAEGDAVLPSASLYGVQYVMLVSEDGSLQYGTSTTPMVVGDGSGAMNVICDSGCSGGTQYAEDAVHASGNTGTLALVVRNDAGTALAADGDNIPLMVNSAGALYVATGTVTVTDGAGAMNVICDSGCSGGTQFTHDAALTIGSSATTLAGARASAAVPTDVSADNDAVALWALRSGALATQPTYGGVLAVAGNGASGTGVQRVTIANDSTGILAAVTSITNTVTVAGPAAHDAAASGNPLLSGAYASAAAPSDVSADADVVRLWALRNGSQVVNLAAGGTLITGTSTSLNVNCTGGCSGGTQYTQDAALTVGTTVGTMAMGRASAAAPTDVSADGDAVLPWYLRNGAQATVLTAAGALIGGDATNGIDVDVTRVTGTVTIAGAVTNAGTFVVQENGAALTALQLIDNLPNALGSTTSGQSGALVLGAVTTAAPSYTTAQSNALSLQTDGSLRAAVTNTVTVGSHAVTNAGTFAVQVDGASLTALQLIDDPVFADDAAFTVATSKVSMSGFTVDETSVDSADEGDAVAARATPDRVLYSAPAATASTSQSALTHYVAVAASTNATNVKNAAGNVYALRFINTTSTTYYLRMYNLAASPTCSSATGFVETIPIPNATGTGAGFVSTQPIAQGYTTGISYCITGGASSTDNTNAATGVYGTVLYK